MFLKAIIDDEATTDRIKYQIFRRVLAQKVYTISKLVQILGLRPEQFEAADVGKLSPENYKSIFGTKNMQQKRESELPVRFEAKLLNLLTHNQRTLC